MKPKLIDINGIKLIYQKVKTNNTFALFPTYTTAALSETDANCGITHFLEHMLSKETHKRTSQDTAKLLQRYFPRFNASTSYQFMKVNCETSIKYIDIGFELFSDIILNAKFSQDKLEKEAKVIEQEIVKYEAENDQVVDQLILSMIFDYPFARNGILGTRKNVLSYTAQDIEKRHKELTCKENLILSFAGNYPLYKVKKLIKQYFSSLHSNPNQKIIHQDIKFNEIEQVKFIKKESERCNVSLAMKINIDKQNEKQLIYLSMLNHFFNRNFGILWNKLREETGLVYTYYQYNMSLNDAHAKFFEFETSKENINQCLTCYADSLKEVYLNGVSEEDFLNLKENLKMILDADIESPYSVALNNTRRFVAGKKFTTIKESLKLLETLNVDEFNKTIKPLLFGDNFISLAIVGNIDKEDVISHEELKKLFEIKI